ncbi:MAG: hypothetical protein ABI520_13850 [Caldimonas sp.]
MSALKKDLPWHAPAAHPLGEAGRRLGAGLLLVASAALARRAAALSPRASGAAARPSEPRFEFHAEAGAPEGALYVDGQLVGHLPGVRRL